MKLLNSFLIWSSIQLAVNGDAKETKEEQSHVRKQKGLVAASPYANPSPLGPGDLNIRFNKIPFPDGAPEGYHPLGAYEYPIQGTLAHTLKTRSLGDCIMTADDYALHGKDASVYIDKIGGPPTYPNSYPMHDFWKDFGRVVDIQLKRRRGVNVSDVMPLPDLWSGYDIHDAAEAVNNEYPGYHQQIMIEWLWLQGVTLDPDIIPFRSKRDFIGLQVGMANLNTWAVGVVSPINFNLKWSMGRPRPEEVAWLIATGESTHGVPLDIVEKIKSMNLKNAAEFTAYKNGSPTHPSWPAMHSAASSASMWIAVVLNDLTPQQYCEALRVDYAVSYARTIAGVHYPSDNIAGLNLGQQILKEKLADHVSTMFGSDRDVVQAKIDRLAFDWADFDPKDCTINGDPVSV